MSDLSNPYSFFARYSADLCLFLLVADCGQLSRAAELCGLSQPRLSQRMKSLEDSLGKPLLLRQRRGVALTRAGQDLRDAVEPHLREASAAFLRLQQRPKRRAVVIETDLALASFRLLPIFPALCADHDSLRLSLLSRQLPDREADGMADLTVRMEPRCADGPRVRCLFPERVVAVCSPGFKARHPQMRQLRDLLDLPLIDLTSVAVAPWFTWPRWLQHHGLSLSGSGDRLSFSSYDHVIQSAEEGLGIALGWRGLIDSRLAAGRLVPAFETEAESDQGYVLRMTAPRPAAEVRAVFDWISLRLTGPEAVR
ncbi:LysR family transcriptional regulator [Salipiger marinus]|uniref:LysR family transcriptional regulator n=1 Tax=Salipiger marinus TaxID=555512 RepID=UPI004058D660